MQQIRLFNTLHRRIEPFQPLRPPRVLMYTCGPTVYRPVHIGNLRSYLLADWLRRVLAGAGYEVRQVVNITDVGHMRQEQLDRGEDKVVAAALAAGQTPAEIAAFYTDAFQRDRARLNILPAAVYPRASEHVPQMIEIIERLLARGCAYEAAGNVYFDADAFPAYGELSGNRNAEELAEAVRVQADPLKRAPRDFALWKAAEPGRTLQWPSPWGAGFPGWHIECSAMAMTHLGESLDLHTGGVDNIFPHHEDERAQSEAANGRRFAGHWVHGQHLLVDGLKMAKSTGNAYTLEELERRGFEPLAFRYLCLTAHYRHRLNFSFAALRAAQQALAHLRERVQLTAPAEDVDTDWAAPWRTAFAETIANDLNLPAALGVLWQMLHAPGPEPAKVALLLEADGVLGLQLSEATEAELPEPIARLSERRMAARERGDFAAADRLRETIHGQGYEVHDLQGADGPATLTLPKTQAPRETGVTAAAEIPSLLERPDEHAYTIGLVVGDALDDLQRCMESVLRRCDGEDFELLVVDNGSADGTAAWLEQRSVAEPRLRVLRADHNLGEGAGRNAVLKQALGRTVVLIDTSVELTGNPLPSLSAALGVSGAGAAGGFGLSANSLHCFDPLESRGSGSWQEADALEGYLFAIRRARVREVGLMDEKYRFYRNLDLDYSYQVRDRGYRLLALPGLPLVLHPHRIWHSLGEEQREALSKKNFDRFLHRWRHRAEELLSAGAAGR